MGKREVYSLRSRGGTVSRFPWLPSRRTEYSRSARTQNAIFARWKKPCYCEKGYINQPTPIATSRKARNAHRVYFARSVAPRLERNAKVMETTRAKNNSAPKWVRLANREIILPLLLVRYHRLRAPSGN